MALDPTEVANDGSSSTGTRPRLVACETRFLLFWIDTSDVAHDLVAISIDPADLASTVTPGGVVIESGINDYYDVVQVPGEDTAIGAVRLTPTTSYELFSVPADNPGDAAVATAARECDGPIAVACTPDGTQVQVIRATSAGIKGDLITIATLADTAHINKAVGAEAVSIFQIAACFRSTPDGGEHRCYAFWHYQEEAAGSVDWATKVNYVDTAGSLGVAAVLVRKAAVASRAFDHDGRIFVHVVFAMSSTTLRDFKMQLQSTYFLYRDDGLLTAKIAPVHAGGFPPSRGRLPHVQLVDDATYAWCATERRIVRISPTTRGYEDRGPRDVKITFDSNEARRCVRLGQTLYVTGGEIMQYDGLRLVELGFHVYPWRLIAVEDDGDGEAEDGTYAFKATMRDTNARGERDRSTTATHSDAEVSGGTPQGFDITVTPLYITHRHFVSGSDRNPAIEIWRSEKDAGPGADFFLVTSKDPIDIGANGYLANDPTQTTQQFDDEFSDDDLANEEANPENGGVLENLSPPAATIILANDDRLFLAGIAGDRDRVWYSKQRNDGEVASFHDALVINVPTAGGTITGLAFHNETLTVFRETAVYRIPGEGLDNVGGGQNFGPAFDVSLDVGAVNQESILDTPLGTIFKSRKGWQMIDRGWGIQYIGGPIKNYDAEEVLAVDLLETQHHVRVLTSARVLLWNYPATPEEGRGQWAEWTVDDGVHAALWNGAHVYLAATGPMVQQAVFEDLTYGLDVETTWIKPLDLQGEVMIDKLLVLGEYRSADFNALRIRAKYNYDDATYVDDRYWDVSPTTVGGPLQLKIGLKRPRCQSFKLRLTPVVKTELVPEEGPPVISYSPPSGEALKLTGLALRVGAMGDLYNQLPAEQRK